MTNARLEQILDAAYSCFTRHGAQRTTMEDIAKESGMSRGAVYQYVRNKEEAFQLLAQRLFAETLVAARAGIDTGSNLTDKLIAALTAKLELALRLWRDSPHAAELLGNGARMSADFTATYTATMHDLIRDTIVTDHPDIDAAEVAELLLALTRGLETDLSDPDGVRRRLHRGVALIVAGLRHTPTNHKDTQ